MYLHLGLDTVVREEEIVGIFDMDNTTSSKWTRRFLTEKEKNGLVTDAVADLPKSFVLLRDGSVILSQLNPSTLRLRWESGMITDGKGTEHG